MIAEEFEAGSPNSRGLKNHAALWRVWGNRPHWEGSVGFPSVGQTPSRESDWPNKSLESRSPSQG